MKAIDYLAEELKQAEPVVDFLHERLKHEAIYGATLEERETARKYVEAVEPTWRPNKVMVKAARAGR